MTSHRLSKHPLYGIWYNMIDRCHNPECCSFKYYGGRGIQVCDRWHDVRNFVADIYESIGPRPDGHSLDRINNDGDYEPGNVQWATRGQQARNRRKPEPHGPTGPRVIRGFLRMRQAAEYIDIPLRTFEKNYKAWRVPHFNIGGGIFYRPSELDAWLETRRAA